MQIWYRVNVYDIEPTWWGWGAPGRTLLGSPHSFNLFSDSLTLELPGYPDHREINVTAAAIIHPTPTVGLQVGTAGPFAGGLGLDPGPEFLPLSPVPTPTGDFGPVTLVSPRYSLTFFTNRPPLLLEQLANGLQLVRNLASQFAEKAGLIIQAITTDPNTFLQNLLSGLGDAVRQVFDNLTQTPFLQNKLYKWLVGGIPSLSSLGTLDFSSLDNVKSFLLQYAGLTWPHVQDVLKRQLGAGNYAAATQVATLLFGADFAEGGEPPLLDFLQNLPSRLEALGSEYAGALEGFSWSALAEELIDKAKGQLLTSLAKVAPRLLAKFVPGVGVAQSLYQGLSFLLANQSQMGDLFTGFFNAIDDLVAGQVGAYKDRLVEAIQGPGLDLLLNFAAAQLGLGSLRTDLQKAISFVPGKVDEAMRKMVAAIAAKLVNVLPDSLGNAGGLYAGQMAPPTTFTYNGTNYTLWVAKDRTGTKVKLASGTTLVALLTPASFDNTIVPNAREHLQALVNAAQAVATAGNVRDMAVRWAALNTAQAVVVADILNNACRVLNNAACFAAGTKLWTPQGYRNVEDIQPGELVYSRDEYDPCGPIAAKQVEEKFDRTGCILHLHLPGAKLIRTTPEHPFFVYDKGWTATGALQAGDRIRTGDGWVAVEEVYDTGTYEKVYNLRVADYHTYFVGDEEWDFTVWSHNVICGHRESSTARNPSYARSTVDDPAVTNPANQILQAERRARAMPRAGTSADNATLAYLQIVGESHSPIFASNSDDYTYDFPTVGTGPDQVPVGQGVSLQARRHAEIKAMIRAVQSDADLLRGKALIIFTDRDPCSFCDLRRGIENAARILGAVSVTIWCPSGRIGTINL